MTESITRSGRYSVIEYRNQKDFRYGSFEVYVKPNELIISGVLKTGQRSRYLRVVKNG